MELVLIVVAFVVAPGRGLVADDLKVAPVKAAVETTEMPPKVSEAFAKADRNSDRQLTLDEFLLDLSPTEAKRDFLLFDQDANGVLSPAEFWSIPYFEPEFRGQLPDPMGVVVDMVVSALDASLDNWNEKPAVQVNAKLFTAAFWKRFDKYLPPQADGAADGDKNGKISRDEARRFLEIEFGVRRSDGKLLRLPNGRVVNYSLFLHIDLNKNDKLERAEFVERSAGGANVDKEFDTMNRNGDDSLSFDEWSLAHWRLNDPVLEFRQMDTNFDAYVDYQELLAGTPDWKKNLVPTAFPGFDLNRDGKLSLPEYRLTMQTNMVLPWQTAQSDFDGDGTLSFAEFKFDPPLFPLLRIMYFNRLDLDSSGSLDPKEFAFVLKVPDEFFVMNADGTGWRSLFKFEGHPACGSPAVSPDGTMIAFDAVPLKQQDSAVFMMSINGGEPKEIGFGMMPSWSSDGTQLVCSRSGSNGGLWILNLDDELHEFVCAGVGGQLSPDGTKMAFRKGNILQVYDFDTETTHTILGREGNPYQQVFWKFTWSPDGNRLCFKGAKADGTLEIATMNSEGDKPELKVHYSNKVAVNADFAWHPDGNRIVFAMHCPERNHTQLYEFNPNTDSAPTLIKGQDATRNNTDMCWTPDGKRLIIISGDY